MNPLALALRARLQTRSKGACLRENECACMHTIGIVVLADMCHYTQRESSQMYLASTYCMCITWEMYTDGLHRDRGGNETF